VCDTSNLYTSFNQIEHQFAIMVV